MGRFYCLDIHIAAYSYLTFCLSCLKCISKMLLFSQPFQHLLVFYKLYFPFPFFFFFFPLKLSVVRTARLSVMYALAIGLFQASRHECALVQQHNYSLHVYFIFVWNMYHSNDTHLNELYYYNPIYNWTSMRVQRTRTKQLRALLTTTLGHPKSMQCNFNSCSFNYKSDYNVNFWIKLNSISPPHRLVPNRKQCYVPSSWKTSWRSTRSVSMRW